EVSDRFERGGLVGTVIRENVARGYGPKGIHESLMRSPGHRVNILAPDVTHVGVGAVLGEAETDVVGAPRPVFATQNFYKKPGAGAPVAARLAPTIVARVDTLRKEAGLSPVQWDDALSEIATRRATAVARRRKPAADEAEVFALGFSSMEAHQLKSIDFDALTTVALWRERLDGVVGLGVVRAPESRTQEGGFVAVVIVATRP
ncbi:MAG: CAP domain-containing protein, partial [Myxococcota bacterium]